MSSKPHCAAEKHTWVKRREKCILSINRTARPHSLAVSLSCYAISIVNTRPTSEQEKLCVTPLWYRPCRLQKATRKTTKPLLWAEWSAQTGPKKHTTGLRKWYSYRKIPECNIWLIVLLFDGMAYISHGKNLKVREAITSCKHHP